MRRAGENTGHPRMRSSQAKTHKGQRPARSTPPAPYHIPWPNFKHFSTPADERFLSPKQLAS
jgi:hypothetical protein